MEEQLIVKMYGGSKLYGLDTLQSDTDIVGIFLPNKEDLILQKAPEEYNLNNKGCSSCLSVESSRCPLEKSGCEYIKDKSKFIEEKYFSLHKFLDLCYKGIPVALEMLGSTKKNIIKIGSQRRPLCDGAGCYGYDKYAPKFEYDMGDLEPRFCPHLRVDRDMEMVDCGRRWGERHWDFLVANRKKFFTKDLKGFLGYAKSQAHLYSRKGDRVLLIEELLEYFKLCKDKNASIKTATWDSSVGSCRLSDMQDKYGKDNLEDLEEYGTLKVPHLKICGKYFPMSITIKETIARLENMRDRYGKRAEEASTNKADFKAISHAYRVIYEVMSIAKTGDLQFPFTEDIKNKIMDIKLGKVTVEKCYDELEILVKEAEELLQKSDLPEKISNETRKFFEDWLLSLYQ